MATEPVERRLAAILAADIAGYSRLMGADEEGTLAQVKAHRRELIDPKVNKHRGRIVKTTGDGILIEFPSVIEAVCCAVAVQRGMMERNAGTREDKRITFRVGVNLGDIIVEDGDINRTPCNRADFYPARRLSVPQSGCRLFLPGQCRRIRGRPARHVGARHLSGFPHGVAALRRHHTAGRPRRCRQGVGQDICRTAADRGGTGAPGESRIGLRSVEGSASRLNRDENSQGQPNEKYALTAARILVHYMVNGGFLDANGEASRDNNYILEHVARLRDIPVNVVHGRYDRVCHLYQAEALVRALRSAGNNGVNYFITTAGHSSFEPETDTRLRTIMNELPPMTPPETVSL